MRLATLCTLHLIAVTAAVGQGWGRTFDTSFGNGVDAVPLASGGAIVYAQEQEHLVKIDVNGSVVWEKALAGCGSLETLTEQPNGELVGVCYVNDPGGLNDVTYPAIVRLDQDGQLIWGVGYPADSVWIYRPTQVINADGGEFYVLYTGMNTHRVAKYQAGGTMLWTRDFTGTGFGSFGVHIPGGNLHLFNGPEQIVLSPSGTLLWEKYHWVGGWTFGFTNGLYDAGVFNHYFAMATLLQPGGPGNPLVPGITLLDTLGNVLTSATWEALSASSISENEPVISRTTTGFALACSDEIGNAYLLTCDSTLTWSSMTAHRLPFATATVNNGQERPDTGLLFCGTDGDFFTGDRYVYQVPPDGDVSTCSTPAPFTANSVPPETPLPDPFPTTLATPVLSPAGAVFATVAISRPSSPFCLSVGAVEHDPLDLFVHPNPSPGTAVLGSRDLTGPVRLSILDLSGREVRASTIVSFPASIARDGLAPGRYHLRAIDAAGRTLVAPLVFE